MTPLILKAAKLLPYPGDGAQWFDFGRDCGDERQVVADAKLLYLPYPLCVFCQEDSGGSLLVIRAKQGAGSVTLVGLVSKGKDLAFIEPFSFVNDGGDIRILAKKQPLRSSVELALGMLDALGKASSNQRLCSYAGQPDGGYTSRKRMKAGKAPLSYTWVTRVLELSPPKLPYQGGTHASPRAHDRRGHWRNHPSGKKIWVSACRVGEPSSGAVLKDYKVPAPAPAPERTEFE